MADIDEAVGIRYKVNVAGEKYYIAVFPSVYEIFISGKTVTEEHETLARLISKVWCSIGIDECLDQLAKTSRYKQDMPGIIHTILSKFLTWKK